nr:T9SS type A sorting domain-containing protein [Bacteroidales bacterium]
SITMHVDAVEQYEYEGRQFKLLRVSDDADIFSGDIVCGIGHLTSFFPEKLMNKDAGYRVENIRCYWQDGELVYQNGNQDCDEIYEQHHLSVNEINTETGFAIYPNPSNNVLFVKTCHGASLQSEYRITNILGETVISGRIASENQQINVSSLPEGIYFISIGNATMKFLKR